MTTYQFIITSQTRGAGVGAGGRKSTAKSKKTTAKSTTILRELTNNKGGVEHNRKLRAVNHLFNKATGGIYEQAVRVGRAGLGLVKFDKESGKAVGLSGPAIAIIIAFVLSLLDKLFNSMRKSNEETNQRNYKALENGSSQVKDIQSVTANWFTGKINYNENR